MEQKNFVITIARGYGSGGRRIAQKLSEELGIPFYDRKMGRKKIEYDLPQMEEILKDTYGVTVYQEQVMLLSQKLAGFSKGKADKLRKAMGKKKIDVMEGLFQDYLKGGMENGSSLK